MQHLILMAGTYLIIQMTIIWLIYRVTNNPSVVDVSWSPGIMITGFIYLSPYAETPRIIIVELLLLTWSLRLALHLWYTRIRKGHIDKRYTELSEDWKLSKSLGFFLNFQLQAILILILSSVFLLIPTSEPSSLLLSDYFGATLVLIGIIGESLCDLQLYQFKQSGNRSICQKGMWYYSRHPNYFFDLLTWIGFSFFCYHHLVGMLGVISPLSLYLIFTQLTIPITEASSIKSRGNEYLFYQRTTSMLIPWFKK